MIYLALFPVGKMVSPIRNDLSSIGKIVSLIRNDLLSIGKIVSLIENAYILQENFHFL